jgi:ferrous iron transport protein B
MGVDWRVGIGLISAFAAREVFVSSLAVVFSVADDNEDSMRESLVARMTEAKLTDGSPLFTVASVTGLIVFFIIALQCLSTTAVASRETGSWKFALLQLVAFNLVAYLAAVGVVHGLRALGVH